MTTHDRAPESRERQAIRQLLAARGIMQHALFLTQREGQPLPAGLEAVSGFALDATGAVYGFWLTWDERRQTLTLDPFHRVPEPDAVFSEDAEYQAARRALRL